LGQWASEQPALTAANVGAVAVVWRGTLYTTGGCSGMNGTNLYCTTALASTQYGTVTSAGQASVIKTSTVIPKKLFGAATVISNGFIYVIGGCQYVSGTT